MTDELSIDQVLELLPSACEILVDAAIAAEPDPHARRLLQRNRARLIDKAVDASAIANLRQRNAELEERLRPRLVD